MKKHSMPEMHEGGVNVTPLIDIVMVLIVFFMLVAKIGVTGGQDPNVTITRGSTSSIVRRKKLEQFVNSFCDGLRFAPDSERGLHKAALVMKISLRVRLIEFKNRSRFAPD